MCTARHVAEYFIALQGEDASDAISNMKLQKLLYYAQGFSLAILDKPLFGEDFEAWQYGPVLPCIYREYKKYGLEAIPHRDVELSNYTKEEKDLLDSVYNVFGQYSAWALSNMSHETMPWKNTKINETISKTLMTEFFITQTEE